MRQAQPIPSASANLSRVEPLLFWHGPGPGPRLGLVPALMGDGLGDGLGWEGPESRLHLLHLISSPSIPNQTKPNQAWTWTWTFSLHHLQSFISPASPSFVVLDYIASHPTTFPYKICFKSPEPVLLSNQSLSSSLLYCDARHIRSS